MVEQVTFQTIFQFLQTVALIVGVYYYIMTIRVNQRNQELTLNAQRQSDESRQLQFLLFLTSSANVDFSKIQLELINMNWVDYDDFEKRYGSDNNPDNYAKRVTVWMAFESVGLALKRGLIDRDMVCGFLNVAPVLLWAKFGDVIHEIKRRYNQPLMYSNFEYLAEECAKYISEQGHDPSVPETFYSYVPEE
jgi:hypothetical protein